MEGVRWKAVTGGAGGRRPSLRRQAAFRRVYREDVSDFMDCWSVRSPACKGRWPSDNPGCCSESLGSLLSKHTNSQAPFQTYKRISGRLGLKMFISKKNTRRLESSVCLQIIEENQLYFFSFFFFLRKFCSFVKNELSFGLITNCITIVSGSPLFSLRSPLLTALLT